MYDARCIGHRYMICLGRYGQVNTQVCGIHGYVCIMLVYGQVHMCVRCMCVGKGIGRLVCLLGW
jgi:hypothetical protein